MEAGRVPGFFSFLSVGLVADSLTCGFGGVPSIRFRVSSRFSSSLFWSLDMPQKPDPFHLTDVDSDTATQIGRFMVAWGRLEGELDLLFPVLFRIDPTLSMCLTANLGTKGKVDCLRSALSMITGVLPPETVKELDECLVLTSELSDVYRNFLAHGQPAVFASPRKQEWIWTRWAARKELQLTIMQNEDAEHWRMGAGLVWIVIEGVHVARNSAHAAISPLGRRAWAKACTIPAKSFRKARDISVAPRLD